MSSPDDHVTRRDAVAVSAFAAAVQLAQHLALRSDPSVRGPVIDGWTFHGDALQLLSNAPAPAGLYWQSPWFVWALAGVYRVFGADPARGLWLTSAGAVACVALVHALARACGLTRRAAIASGVVAALYGPLLFFSAQLIAAPLDAAAALLALLVALKVPPSSAARWHCLSGLALGLAAAQRGTVWPFAVYGLATLWRARTELGPAPTLRRAGAYALGAAVAQLPVALGNLRRAGTFTTMTTNAGVNLWLGNNADIARTTAARPGCGWDWLTLEPVRHGVFSAQGRSRWFTEEAIRWSLSHPLAALINTFKKLSDVFNGLEVPRNLDPYGELARTPLNAALLGGDGLRVPFGLVLPLAAVGAWHLWHRAERGREVRAVLSFVGLNALGIAMFLPAGRYRLGLALALIPLAVAGAASLRDTARDRVDGPCCLALALAIALFSNLTPRFTGPDLSRADATLRAEAYFNARALPRARALLTDDLARHGGRADDADRWEFLGRVCGAMGDYACADAALQRAITLEPRCYDVAARLGGLRLARGDARGAADAFERSIRVVPMQPSTWFGLAEARAMGGDAPGAERARAVGERLRAAIRQAR